MKNKYIKTINLVDKNSLNETIWTEHDKVFKTQYKNLNKSHLDILGYHFAKYPNAHVDIFEFLKKEEVKRWGKNWRMLDRNHDLQLYFQISLNDCLEELYVFIFITSEVFNEQDFLEERTLSR